MGAFTPPLKKQTKTNHEQKKAYRDDKLFSNYNIATTSRNEYFMFPPPHI